MTMRHGSPSRKTRIPTAAHAPRLRLLTAGLLGFAAALLVSCGTSGKGLIPIAHAGPLQSDFEAVAQRAQSGNGDCVATEEALAKTEQDFSALPSTIDAGLLNTLRQGIENLHTRSLAVCAEPFAPTTATSTTPKTTTTATTPTTTTPTTPTTTTLTTTTPTTPITGAGTPAPGVEEPSPGADSGQGGGTGAGENPSGGGGANAGGAGAGGQGGGK